MEKESVPCCEEREEHGARIASARESMPPDALLFNLADLYKVFADGTRVRILYALFDRELCVCDIAALLGMTLSAISHQLRILKQAKLVRFRREGKTVYYALSDDHVRLILGQGMDHVRE